MIRQQTAARIQSAIDRLVSRRALPAAQFPSVEVEPPKQAEHGDFATNWAMVAFKSLSGAPSSSGSEGSCRTDEEGVGGGDWPKNPRALGELLATELGTDDSFTKVDVAGPGFVNLVLADSVCSDVLGAVRKGSEGSVLENPTHFGRPSQPSPTLHLNLEFVSVNPNGPITIGSGRGAAYGSTLANVLEAAGHTVHREYYINDGVNSEQMRLFAESVKAICEGKPVPDNGYKGDYVSDVAASITGSPGDLAWYQSVSQSLMLDRQRADLEAFGVMFDTWFSEQSLHDSGEVDRCIDALEKSGVADDQPFRTKVKFVKGGVIEEVVREEQVGDEDGDVPQPPTPTPSEGRGSGKETLWLRSTLFGDDMDRVLRRNDGRLTYIASDVAYHKDKFKRGGKAPSSSGPDGLCRTDEEGVGGGDLPRADKLITVLGPDHHGYIGRLHAVVAAELMAEGSSGVRESMSAETSNAELSEQEAKLYGTRERRDACQAALALSYQKLEVLIFQLVRFMKDGKPAPMRKRDGNIYALIDLVNEIGDKVKPNGSKKEKQEAGKDVARFFYLMRHHDTTFDFDLDLAEKQSDENPVFYVQYAHARICGVLRKAEVAGVSPPPTPSSFAGHESSPANGEGALHPREKALILKIADLPHEVARCAEDYAVSRLTTYAIELARAYHGFYDACRVIDPANLPTTQWRLSLCEATRAALRATLDLLGVSAPEKMEREVPSP